MKLSINLNKIALLRNARGGGIPNLEEYADLALAQDIVGITIHPRPDLRHITFEDAQKLKNLTDRCGKELNIEGNPKERQTDVYPGFLEIIKNIEPHQTTFVPDESNQLTSDHGWDLKSKNELEHLSSIIASHTNICSIFVDSNLDDLEAIISKNINSIEIFTGPFANAFTAKNKKEIDNQLQKIEKLAEKAKTFNLKVNAGHDLDTNNLVPLVELGLIDEVSIGHAIISESLQKGFKKTIIDYIKIING